MTALATPRTKTMLDTLGREEIHTWFDLGLFLDQIRRDRLVPSLKSTSDYTRFKANVANRIAFVTFCYTIDGVTVEIGKYAQAFQEIIGDVDLYLVGGRFFPQADSLLKFPHQRYELPEIDGFDAWPLYADFFHTKLDRGGTVYNRLVVDLWKAIISICDKLGSYLESHDIGLLFLANTHSNPGNVALAVALCLISELMGFPVLCNNHDFYWEGGARAIDRKRKRLGVGPRDHFFTNSHLGEVFSILELIYPWESRSWVSVNINAGQSEQLIRTYGHNPANIADIGTCVNTADYTNLSKRRKLETFVQIAKALSGYQDHIKVLPAQDLESSGVITPEKQSPVLVGAHHQESIDFVHNNILFLQPTRIIPRKTIGLNLRVIRRLLTDLEFADYFRLNTQLKITLLITGPVALGHYRYLLRLLKRFDDLCTRIDKAFVDRVFIGFLFSEIDKPEFREAIEHPIGMPEIYNIASVVLLPSETEGRGLPIIESAACGIPILTRRYYPEEVYSHVIGEHLANEERLKVIEFVNPQFEESVINKVKNRILFPQDYNDESIHNRHVIEKRYSLRALCENIDDILHQLFLQLQPNEKPMTSAVRSIQRYNALINENGELARAVINSTNRQYLPGYGQLGFMLMLKSVIDPSYFRVEEQRTRGLAMAFAHDLIFKGRRSDTPKKEDLHRFFNSIDNIFLYQSGNIPVRLDHSLAYRHRNTSYFPYRDLTCQELTGVINLLFHDHMGPTPGLPIEKRSPHHFSDWHLMINQICGSMTLAIDHRTRLFAKLKENIPLIIFPAYAVKHELELFVLQTIRARLNLPLEQPISEDILEQSSHLAPIHIVASTMAIGSQPNADMLKQWIMADGNEELKLVFKYDRCRIVASSHLSVGLDFRQLGKEALGLIKELRDRGGVLITCSEEAAMMTDIADVDRFHIGKVTHEIMANIMGIPIDSAFVQWAPPGLRFTLAYPTPIQTGKDFSEALNSPLFASLCQKLGEPVVLKMLKKDAEANGTPIAMSLKRIKEGMRPHEVSDKPDVIGTSTLANQTHHPASGGKTTEKPTVNTIPVNGIYADGLPWSGVMVTIDLATNPMNFISVKSEAGTKTVMEFVKTFEMDTGQTARIAWNGGYILNPELVGKLGLPETYIGSPLGLIVTEDRIICPPLFNKPALIIRPDGALAIQRVNASCGITLSAGGISVKFPETDHNRASPPDKHPCYYDLLYKELEVPGDGRTIVRIAQNVITEIIPTGVGGNVPIIPVGLTLSFPAGQFPDTWDCGTELEFDMHGWQPMRYAIEAGPLLVTNGKVCIDMDTEGWTHVNSIRSQAARLDYLDMRGPKIAAGLSETGALTVLTINGRIRESVGATHGDMADILVQNNIVTAMGFDPGGSSTLVVDHKTLNISPFNYNYESNNYALPPEPRQVSSVVIGY